jgi:hypothetical protein
MRLFRSSRGVIALLGSLTTTPLAHAQSKSEPPSATRSNEPVWGFADDRSPAEIEQAVKAHMKRGIELLKKGDLEGAHAAFLKAWDDRPIVPIVPIASGLASLEMQLGRYREAAGHWSYVIRNTDNELQEQAMAETQLAECKKHLGSLRVVLNGAPDAIIFVNDRAAGAVPLDSEIWVDPGEHVLWARHGSVYTSRSSTKVTFSIAAGQSRTVTVAFEQPAEARPVPAAKPAPAAPIPPARDRSADRGMSTRTVVVIGGVALTAVATTIGIVYAVKADRAEDELREIRRVVAEKSPPELRGHSECGSLAPNPPAECSELRAKADERSRTAGIANGAIITAGALGAATLGAFLFWPDDEPVNKRARLRVAPWPLGRERGVTLDLRF